MKQETARRAFTLIEMLIVVAILAVLMTIVFRLGSLGGTDSRRTTTVVRLQKVENCLSGYYAAFGSYPPVKVHGYRSINQPVDMNGDQTESSASGNLNQSEDGLPSWWQVEAACRSQPFGCEYPPSTSSSEGRSEQEIIKDWSDEIQNRVGNSSEYPLYASGTWSFAPVFQGGGVAGPDAGSGFNDAFGPEGKSDWKVVKLFKFGVMSFLLPRYLFMMGGDSGFFEEGESGRCAQWCDNNDLPCDPSMGSQYEGWDDVIRNAHCDKAENQLTSSERNDIAKVANIPSQAVCARWMPNLEGICSTIKAKTFFGITIGSGGLSPGWEDGDGEIHPPDPATHTHGGKTYKNASITVHDGWGSELYYYSPAPYQTYTLWSAGPNGKTFPPWMDVNSLKSGKETAQSWKSDDIMQMSH